MHLLGAPNLIALELDDPHRDTSDVLNRSKRERKMSKKPEVTESDGNNCADLGIDNADEFYTRACLGVQVMKLLKGRSQKEAAKLLGFK